MRDNIVDMARKAARSDGAGELSGDDAIAWACQKSSYFCGLFKLLDVEVRLAVEPFISWEQGDMRSFLRAFPSMCALVASGPKVKVIFRFIMC